MAKEKRKQAAGGRKKVLLVCIIILSALLLAGIITVCYFIQKEKAEQAAELERQRVIAVSKAVEIDAYYEGISVAGVDLGGKTKDEAKEAVKKVLPGLRQPIDISVKCPSKTHKLTADDFVYQYNTNEVLEQAYQVARTGTNDERYEKIQDLKEHPVDFPITCTLDKSSAKAVVEKIAKATDIAAQEPKVSSFMPQKDIKFVMADGKNGLKLDQKDLRKKLDALLNKDCKGTIQAVTTVIPFKQTISEAEKRVELLSTFSTTSTNTKDADHNMKLALAAANGTVLEPGETFSFNGATGDTTNGSLGYRKANAISGGKLTPAYGGGICQASTTIYGAALRANLKIVERHPHSWPSTYVPIGLDASVNYPNADFKFQNQTKNQIFISAYMKGKKLTVEIYGTPSTEYDTIKVTSQRTESIKPGSTKYVNDSSLKAGTRKVDVRSRTGYRAKAYKIFYKNGKEVKREQIASSYYRPIAGVVRVGTKK